MFQRIRKWFSGLTLFKKVSVVGVMITGITLLLTIPLFLNWLSNPVKCKDNDYQYCEKILKEFQKEKINHIYTEPELFEEILKEKFGLTKEQIKNLAENFRNYAKTEYDKGLALSGLGKYNKAINHFNNAIELNNTNPHFYYSKSVAQFYLGNYTASLETINKALKFYNHISALNAKAKILGKLGEYEKAVSTYN